MWLSEKLRRGEETAAAGETGTVSIEGAAPAVLAGAEERAEVLSPGGYSWRPRRGETVMLLRGGAAGEARYVAGRVQGEQSLAPGEVRIASAGGASITLRNDGTVDLTGTVRINGVVFAPAEETNDGT